MVADFLGEAHRSASAGFDISKGSLLWTAVDASALAPQPVGTVVEQVSNRRKRVTLAGPPISATVTEILDRIEGSPKPVVSVGSHACAKAPHDKAAERTNDNR